MGRYPASELLLMLKRRGFSVSQSGPRTSVPPLLPADPGRADSWYGSLHHYSFRLFLKDVIKYRELFRPDQVSRYVDEKTCLRYIGYLEELGMVRSTSGGFTLVGPSTASFGPTLEWYTAELLRREFAMSVLWGVRFKNGHTAGDFDVLAGFDGRLLCIETKSSPPGQIGLPEVRSFFERLDALRPDVAMFLNDTRLRMRDKIVPLFNQALSESGTANRRLLAVAGERFRLGHRIFVMNARPGILFNIREALRIYYRESGALF